MKCKQVVYFIVTFLCHNLMSHFLSTVLCKKIVKNILCLIARLFVPGDGVIQRGHPLMTSHKLQLRFKCRTQILRLLTSYLVSHFKAPSPTKCWALPSRRVTSFYGLPLICIVYFSFRVILWSFFLEPTLLLLTPQNCDRLVKLL